jgi:hypothetical protein
MIRASLRLALVGLAALASAATSVQVEQYDVEEVTPLPGETAVSLAAVPTVQTTSSVGLGALPSFRVFHEDGTEVAGAIQESSGNDPKILQFFPEGGLAPDTDYRLVFEDAAVEFRWYDPIDERHRDGYPGDPEYRIDFSFSTRSAPAVRVARYYPTEVLYRLSFSQDMDPASLTTETVIVRMGDDSLYTPTEVTYLGGVRHELVVQVAGSYLGPTEIVFTAGVAAADGSPLTQGAAAVEYGSR